MLIQGYTDGVMFFVTDIFGPDSDAVLWVFIPAHWSLLWLTASIFIPLHHLVVGSTGTGSSSDDTTDSAAVTQSSESQHKKNSEP